MTPTLGVKLSKTVKIHDLENFRQFLGQKVDQMLFDYNLRPDLESSHYLASLRALFLLFPYFEFLALPCKHGNFKADEADLDIDRF